MAYCDAADVKQYLGKDGAEDDTLLESLISRAQKAIEQYTRRQFEAATETRYFDQPSGRMLYTDEDLLAVTTLTNGDGTTIASADYQLLPLNESPKYAIRLKQGSNLIWEDDSDGNSEGVITVAGSWGYSTAPPGDIVHACVRLAGYWYKQREAQVFDVTAIPEQGALLIPKGIPPDVKMILDRYVRASL